MKKLSVILVTLAAILSLTGNCYAASTEAINPEAQPVTLYGKVGNGIGKISAGGTTVAKYGTGLIRTGACWVKSVSMYAPSIGDAVMIYNGLDAATTGIEFELSISAATSNPPAWNAGAYFDQGIYIHATDTDVLTNIVFDY